MTSPALDKIFYPSSIAVIGASTQENTVGSDLIKNLKTGFAGKIYPVNPKATELQGLPCFASVTDITEPVDLAIIAVKAPIVPVVLQQAADRQIKAAIIISSGFREMGEDGQKLENQVKEICEKNNIALIGPNCLGVLNPEINLNASFSPVLPRFGSMAFISQSGALIAGVIDAAENLKIGFSKITSIGNKACISEVDLIRYLAKDPATRVILMYIEELKNAAEFLAVARETTRINKKPIIVLKAGTTQQGAQAAISHTGALGGEDKYFSALFHQVGIIRASSIDELFNLAIVFAKNDMAPAERLVVVTNAGGAGVLTTDEAIAHGLKMASISADTLAKLKEFFPEKANIRNPIDVLGDAKADRYRRTLEIVAIDPEIDSLIAVLTPQTMTEVEPTAESLVEFQEKTTKPLVVSFIGGPLVKAGKEILREGNVAFLSSPDAASRSLSQFSRFEKWTRATQDELFKFNDIDRARAAAVVGRYSKMTTDLIPEPAALEILAAYGFPTLKSGLVHSPEEASRLAPTIGQKIALKIVSPDISHKTEVGGVLLNVAPTDAATKYEELLHAVAGVAPKARIEGVLLVEMADTSSGAELILGLKKVPDFGTAIMVGLGGIYVEVFADVSWGIVPVTKNDARRMIQNLKSARIFAGIRNHPALDVEVLVSCLGRLNQLAQDFPEISELDINPLLLLPHGALLLDARIVIQ